jgi:hypothetical protein
MEVYFSAFIIISIGVFMFGFLKVKAGKSYEKVPKILYPLSMFVWGDSLVAAPFYLGAALVSFVFDDLHLFLLLITSFLLFRSIGETIYWFLVQFDHSGKREKPKDHMLYKLTGNSSVFFIHQVMNQAQSAVLLVMVLYLFKTWNI